VRGKGGGGDREVRVGRGLEKGSGGVTERGSRGARGELMGAFLGRLGLERKGDALKNKSLTGLGGRRASGDEGIGLKAFLLGNRNCEEGIGDKRSLKIWESLI
jgi:hypothetical protein